MRPIISLDSYHIYSANHHFISDILNLAPTTEKVFYKEMITHNIPDWLRARTISDDEQSLSGYTVTRSHTNAHSRNIYLVHLFTPHEHEAMKISYDDIGMCLSTTRTLLPYGHLQVERVARDKVLFDE